MISLELDYFDEELLNVKNTCLIIGDHGSGKSTLVKHFILNVFNIIYKHGCICTNKQDYSFYSSFLNIESIYKRYSSLLEKRCFIDKHFLVIDDYYYNKSRYDEIFMKSKNYDMSLVISSQCLIDSGEYDYIFIRSLRDEKQIKLLFNTFPNIRILFKNVAEFKLFLNSAMDKYEILVLNVKAKDIHNIFYYYCLDVL